MLKARVVITEDGRVAMFIDEGGFGEGKKVIERTLSELEASGITFDVRAPVEQHRHDHEHEGVRNVENAG